VKILTIVGTRPELIRLSAILPKLDESFEHRLVHTNQNFTPELNNIFFSELNLRKPDYTLHNTSGVFGEQLGVMFTELQKILEIEHPDKVLILGDTNSGLCSIVCERMGFKCFHMEAGNRCFDKRTPEEINRKIIDNTCSINLPYTENSRNNLLNGGFHTSRVFVTGNPIYEVLKANDGKINSSNILNKLKLYPGRYILSTFHRAENVDSNSVLKDIVLGLEKIQEEFKFPIIVSTHPKTQSRLKQFNIISSKDIRFLDPMGFFDFAKLEQNAKMVITDSGTVPEEACIFGIPSIIIRNSTERPELIENGSCIVSGTTSDSILNAYRLSKKQKKAWKMPSDYECINVSNKIIKILSGEYNV
jgi:UDP-N-acetylglucosamine 2-epimerase (non-hydrolysing)